MRSDNKELNGDEIKDAAEIKHDRKSRKILFLLIPVIVICLTAGTVVGILEANYDVGNFCYTPSCLEASKFILERADFTNDPCTDFYEYACGNFLKTKMIPPDKFIIDIFEELKEKLRQKVNFLLTDDDFSDTIRPFKLAKNLYKACMNASATEHIGIQKFNKIIDELGGWPVLKGDSWNAYAWTLEDTVIKLRNSGLDYDSLFSINLEADMKDTSRYIITLEQPTLFRTFLLDGFKNEMVRKFFKVMVDVAVWFGANEERARRELKEAVDFEIALTKISNDTKSRRNFNLTYNPITFYELTSKYRNINWLKILTGVLTYPITLDEKINEVSPHYFKNLDILLSKTSRRTIANNLILNTYFTSVTFLSEHLENKLFKSYSSIGVKREPRWKECTYITQNHLSVAVNSMYVKKYFNQNSKNAFTTIVKEIRDTLQNTLTNNDWMSEKVKEKALFKLSKMSIKIDSSNDLLNDIKLLEHYKALQVDGTSYFEFATKIKKFDSDNYYNRLKIPVKKYDWENFIGLNDGQVFYDFQQNSILIPEGIFQSDIFSTDRPYYLNYGGIGQIIGHELTHAFDFSGSNYDWRGDSVNWWDAETEDAFFQKVDGIVRHYDNYEDKVTGLMIDGNTTYEENFADISGIKHTYFAYNNWVRKNGVEQKLPGLQKFTANQMLWLCIAQTWCSKQKIEVARAEIETAFNSPSRFRVLGPLQNIKEFSEDFQCPAGSKMNPITKYRLW